MPKMARILPDHRFGFSPPLVVCLFQMLQKSSGRHKGRKTLLFYQYIEDLDVPKLCVAGTLSMVSNMAAQTEPVDGSSSAWYP